MPHPAFPASSATPFRETRLHVPLDRALPGPFAVSHLGALAHAVSSAWRALPSEPSLSEPSAPCTARAHRSLLLCDAFSAALRQN